MLRAVGDLLNARPHMRQNVQFTVTELRAYQDGYYTALVYALRVLDLAISRYKLATTTRRAELRRRRGA